MLAGESNAVAQIAPGAERIDVYISVTAHGREGRAFVVDAAINDSEPKRRRIIG